MFTLEKTSNDVKFHVIFVTYSKVTAPAPAKKNPGSETLFLLLFLNTKLINIGWIQIRMDPELLPGSGTQKIQSWIRNTGWSCIKMFCSDKSPKKAGSLTLI